MSIKLQITLLTSILLIFSTSMDAQENEWGNLKGQIIVEGDLPEIEPEKIDKDKPVCMVGKEAPLDDNLLIDSSSRGLKDAFVMMYFKRGAAKPPVHESYEKSKDEVIEIDNKNCRFAPHAAFARIGQTIRLKNSDQVGHNCHITLFKDEINVNLPIGEHVDVKFKESEKFPGLVKCDMHQWMDGVLLIREEPYVAITDKDGRFEIKNVPAGEWTYQFWHKRAGYMKDLKVPAGELGGRGEIKLTIEPGKTLDLGKLTFDTAKFKKTKSGK